ncbi:MAG TPA: preprotein translocase subunit SecG [Verrucomicrobiota bacterium]|nr:preprotein translocase subunit SecG [Verrucomicrobiota bacterium]
MGLIITILTVILVIDCFFLGLLIIIQLPKKEAGLGQAFGSAATDMLFGAGSGTVLTKATKYAAALFLGLSLILSIMTSRMNVHKQRLSEFERSLPSAATPVQTQKPPVQKPPSEESILKTPLVTGTNILLKSTNDPSSTNK